MYVIQNVIVGIFKTLKSMNLVVCMIPDVFRFRKMFLQVSINQTNTLIKICK